MSVAPISPVHDAASELGRSKSGLGKEVPFERTSANAFYRSAVLSTASVASNVLTLFIITTYATFQSTGDDLLSIGFQIHTMAFPLIAMILILDMKVEYIFRERIYYGLLDEGVLLDFDSDDSVPEYFWKSRTAKYIVISVLILVVTCLTLLQIGALFTTGVLSLTLLASVYDIRQLEQKLVSLNKFVDKDPRKCAEFLNDIVQSDNVVSEDAVALEMLTIKFAHAKVSKAHKKDKDGLRNARAELASQGIVVTFESLAEKLKQSSDTSIDPREQRKLLHKEIKSEFNWMDRWDQGLEHGRWATTPKHAFTITEDLQFVGNMSKLKAIMGSAVLIVEIYGLVQLIQGSTSCITGE